MLNSEDPLASNNLAVFWVGHDFIDTHGVEGATFVVASEFSLGSVRACHGFCIRVQVANSVHCCDASMFVCTLVWFVRGDGVPVIVVGDEYANCVFGLEYGQCGGVLLWGNGARGKWAGNGRAVCGCCSVRHCV